MNESLLDSLNIKELKNTYKCTQRINTGMGARSFFGQNMKTGDEVFIKFLLFPRSNFEKSRFQNEIFTLEKLSDYPTEISPKFIDKGSLHDDEILYLVTEKIDGISLEKWISDNLSSANIKERFEMFHRVVSATSQIFSIFSHRDLHPGNIILLDKEPEWEDRPPSTEVKIIDWGHSFGPILAGFDDSPDFIIDLYKRMPKEISGSFYCTPPEIFSPSDKSVYNSGKHDAWSLGLLLYKLLTNKDLFSFRGIGDLLANLHDGNLQLILDNAVTELESTQDPSANILSKVFEGLVSLSPESRMDPSTAARIMWDIRIEELTLASGYELNKYIRNPHDYVPEMGWKFSSWPDYD